MHLGPDDAHDAVQPGGEAGPRAVSPATPRSAGSPPRVLVTGVLHLPVELAARLGRRRQKKSACIVALVVRELDLKLRGFGIRAGGSTRGSPTRRATPTAGPRTRSIRDQLRRPVVPVRRRLEFVAELRSPEWPRLRPQAQSRRHDPRDEPFDATEIERGSRRRGRRESHRSRLAVAPRSRRSSGERRARTCRRSGRRARSCTSFGQSPRVGMPQSAAAETAGDERRRRLRSRATAARILRTWRSRSSSSLPASRARSRRRAARGPASPWRASSRNRRGSSPTATASSTKSDPGTFEGSESHPASSASSASTRGRVARTVPCSRRRIAQPGEERTYDGRSRTRARPSLGS